MKYFFEEYNKYENSITFKKENNQSENCIIF